MESSLSRLGNHPRASLETRKTSKLFLQIFANFCFFLQIFANISLAVLSLFN